MKFAGIVLRNVTNPVLSVEYSAVFDALSEGGVYPEEIALLSYCNTELVTNTLSRMIKDYDGVFIVCDRPLLASVKDAVTAAGGTFEGDFARTAGALVGVFLAGEQGAERVKAGMVVIDGYRNRTYARVTLCGAGMRGNRLPVLLHRAVELAGDKMQIHAHEKYGVVKVEVVYDNETPKMLSDEVVRILADGMREYLYAAEDISLPECLVKKLGIHNLRLSTAESFTGGGIGRAVTGVSGASKVFYEGINAYDEMAKAERLGVSPLDLTEHGAVSEEVAKQMAQGLLNQGHCDVAIATTGYAGPTTERGAPVGRCFIAVGRKNDRIRVFRFDLKGSRHEITETAINYSMFLACREIG